VATLTEITVPDIGDFDEIPVIEILVSLGDTVSVETPLLTLESDKATMDVPSPMAGIVREIKVAVGDNVAQGSLIVMLETAEASADSPADAEGDKSESLDLDPAQADPAQADPAQAAPAQAAPAQAVPAAAPPAATSPSDSSTGGIVEVHVPDIGDFDGIPVIEVLVGIGDSVEAETPLVTLESDKATMDVPAPQPGTIIELKIAVGDMVSQGSLIALMRTDSSSHTQPDAPPTAQPEESVPAVPPAHAEQEPAQATVNAPTNAEEDDSLSPADELMKRFHSSEPDPRAPLHRPAPTAGLNTEASRQASHATPALRRFARELGVNLARVSGSGRKGRILREDVIGFVKGALVAPATSAGGQVSPGGSAMGIPPIPEVDFSRFGDIEEQKLSRIKRISGPFLHRAWLNIPHVTHHDEVDITELEAFRKSLADEAQRRGVRVTALTFIMKAVASALAAFPAVNSSLSGDGQSLFLKKYFHIGIAVDTPNGLVVPVIRDVDQKGIFELAEEMAEVSTRARDGKLKAEDLQGGCMSISSLGGIGGTAFTPIVNAPEVAILGVARAKMQPVWDGSSFVPRLMLPLDLSYDHRVIDGAQGARFVAHLGALLTELRRLML
jgi:pyruvate dehydrogenase E2 component (dihydrolipoamide acetyltransferase)